MYMPILLVCMRIFWPYGLLGIGEAVSSDAKPYWVKYGEVAVGLIHSQPDTHQYFVRRCYHLRTLSSAFGINFHFGGMTAGHMTGLRQLLLMAGDVESNPGPANDSEQNINIYKDVYSGATCEICGNVFGRLSELNRHVRIVHEGRRDYTCDSCDYQTSNFSHLKRHQEKHEKPHNSAAVSAPYEEVTCTQCDKVIKRRQDLKRHMKTHEISQPPSKRARFQESDAEIQKIVGKTLRQLINRVSYNEETALNQRLRIVEIDAANADPRLYLSGVAPKIADYVDDELQKKTGIKLQMLLTIKFHKELEPTKCCVRGFRSQQMLIYRGTEYDLEPEFGRILGAIEKFCKEESGWVISQLISLKLYMATCQPLRGSTYKPLPQKLTNKQAIVNVKNTDNRCFLWSILAKMYPVGGKQHPNRVSNYEPYADELNLTGIEFPVSLTQIQKFERQNNLAINVYGYEECLFPLRISSEINKPWIHLLLYEDHYSLIKDLDRLLHDQRGYQHRKFFCPRCLIPRTTRALLDEHLELCVKKEPTKITMPEMDKLKFTNWHKTIRQPMVVYADFECLTEQMKTCSPNASESYTEKYQRHTPCGYGMVQAQGCCGQVKFNGLEVKRGKGAVQDFLQSLIMTVIDYHNTPKMCMTQFDAAKHASNDCHICGKEIKERKVKDHCHICGKYRGPAHNECNQNLSLNKDIVVVFHNLRKYDGHLIMTQVDEVARLNGLDISVVAKAMEDYISFSLVHKKEDDGKGGKKDFKYNIRFVDSLQFLNNSLEGLVENLKKDQFEAMRTEFDGEGLDLLLRKGVYPYDYMNSWEKFEETNLPKKQEFDSKLSGTRISDADYAHARKVWDFFSIRDMGDYHDLYLKTDVLLLADVFENFRSFALEKYGLDPCHYMTAPSLAWDACLKMTKVELELLKDPEMYLFCESGIRGGISMISHRYAKANNPEMADFDPSKPTSYIIYLDANNLYGWAMVQKLPVDGFKWVDDLAKDWASMDPNGDKGYFLEVDLEYPTELHEKHNDYPLAPEPMDIKKVSPYCESLKESMGLKCGTSKKLVPNLFNKTKYILHIRNLRMYLELGMKLKKVHRILEFNQRDWMKDYIMFNTMMRAQATSDFEKNLLKLMNNAVFGKTMENVRKYRNIELVTSAGRFEKLVANPRFQDSCRFTEDLVGVSSLRPSTCLNKPIYCGLTVLDLSKLLMYEFHYFYIVKKYDSRARLLFTDTDSLCYIIETNNIYDDMKRDSHLFDFSDYPREHQCHSTQNKKLIGKMKDEAASEIIEEFAGLRPKMYSIYGPKVQKKRAKGIKKVVVKHEISHKDYVNTLFGESSMMHKMNLIRSDLHQLHSVTVNKKSLSAYDDKRWLLNAVESRAHGHYLNT